MLQIVPCPHCGSDGGVNFENRCIHCNGYIEPLPDWRKRAEVAEAMLAVQTGSTDSWREAAAGGIERWAEWKSRAYHAERKLAAVTKERDELRAECQSFCQTSDGHTVQCEVNHIELPDSPHAARMLWLGDGEFVRWAHCGKQ